MRHDSHRIDDRIFIASASFVTPFIIMHINIYMHKNRCEYIMKTVTYGLIENFVIHSKIFVFGELRFQFLSGIIINETNLYFLDYFFYTSVTIYLHF